MIDLLRQRLQTYASANAVQEEQALKEILQEWALYALWRGGFFAVAAFQGGTSLRILHSLPRFSEDLDFILLKADAAFEWSRYFAVLTDVLQQFGVRCDLTERSQADKVVRQAMIKDNSLGVAASFVRVTQEMTHSGPNLGLPYTRAFGDGLFEIRARGAEGIGRAFFCTLVGCRIMVLHGFIKKTQNTPQAELKLARKRQKDVQHG